MKLRLLDQVRAGCKSVAERAAHVRINYDLISSYAASLPIEKAIVPEHDPQSHYLHQGEDTAAFFIKMGTHKF
jgi:hypothetical protein